jgi:hypothetical protein
LRCSWSRHCEDRTARGASGVVSVPALAAAVAACAAGPEVTTLLENVEEPTVIDPPMVV